MQGRFFEVFDPIQAGCDPVSGVEHVPGDLGLYRIDIVQQRWRAEHSAQEDGDGKEDDD